MNKIIGSCICNAVTYEILGETRDVVACHCVECRKFSGHYIAATAVAPDKLKILNQQGLKWFNASKYAQRGFCEVCGSSMFWKPVTGDRISIFAGTIDNNPGETNVESGKEKVQKSLKLTSHIYASEKGQYYAIESDVDIFEKEGADLTVG